MGFSLWIRLAVRAIGPLKSVYVSRSGVSLADRRVTMVPAPMRVQRLQRGPMRKSASKLPQHSRFPRGGNGKRSCKQQSVKAGWCKDVAERPKSDWGRMGAVVGKPLV